MYYCDCSTTIKQPCTHVLQCSFEIGSSRLIDSTVARTTPAERTRRSGCRSSTCTIATAAQKIQWPHTHVLQCSFGTSTLPSPVRCRLRGRAVAVARSSAATSTTRRALSEGVLGGRVGVQVRRSRRQGVARLSNDVELIEDGAHEVSDDIDFHPREIGELKCSNNHSAAVNMVAKQASGNVKKCARG